MTMRDPAPGRPGTTTLADPYHYADNNPSNRIDPAGTFTQSVVHGSSPGVSGPSGINSSSGLGLQAGLDALQLISSEMSVNRDHPSIRGNRRNKYSCVFCPGYSYTSHLLYMNDLAPVLAEDGLWDHKVPLVELTGARTAADFVPIGFGFEARLDLFSNVHYGYVMRYAAVSPKSIIDYSHCAFGIFVDIGIGVAKTLGRDIRPNCGDQSDLVNRRIDDAAVQVGIGWCDCGRGDGGRPVPTPLEIAAALVRNSDLIAANAIRRID